MAGTRSDKHNNGRYLLYLAYTYVPLYVYHCFIAITPRLVITELDYRQPCHQLGITVV